MPKPGNGSKKKMCVKCLIRKAIGKFDLCEVCPDQLVAETNKEFFESWEREHVELQDKAKAKALDILDNHESPVDPAIQQELDDYLAHCMKRDLG
mgnify:CR=1 FL=1